MTNMDTFRDFVEKMDWGLLREQKHELILLIKDYSPEYNLWGLVELIDAIQDEAVDSGAATEEEVFNLKEE